MKREKIDRLLLVALRSVPGWESTDMLYQAPLEQVTDLQLKRAIKIAGDGWKEMRRRLKEIMQPVEVLSKTEPFSKTDEETDVAILSGTDEVGYEYLKLVRYSDGSVSWTFEGEKDAWRNSDDAANALRQEFDPEEWVTEGYAEFFGEHNSLLGSD